MSCLSLSLCWSCINHAGCNVLIAMSCLSVSMLVLYQPCWLQCIDCYVMSLCLYVGLVSTMLAAMYSLLCHVSLSLCWSCINHAGCNVFIAMSCLSLSLCWSCINHAGCNVLIAMSCLSVSMLILYQPCWLQCIHCYVMSLCLYVGLVSTMLAAMY